MHDSKTNKAKEDKHVHNDCDNEKSVRGHLTVFVATSSLWLTHADTIRKGRSLDLGAWDH